MLRHRLFAKRQVTFKHAGPGRTVSVPPHWKHGIPSPKVSACSSGVGPLTTITSNSSAASAVVTLAAHHPSPVSFPHDNPRPTCDTHDPARPGNRQPAPAPLTTDAAVVIMSGRKLGGGRVLGSGKGLAAPSPIPSASASPRGRSPFPTPDSRPLPIHSSNSTSNSASSPLPSPLTDYGQDLASNVNLAGPSHDATPNGVLVCPICEEHMVGPVLRD